VLLTRISGLLLSAIAVQLVADSVRAFVKQADHASSYVAIAAGIVAVHLLVYLSLRFSVGITRVIREAGIVLLTRISGLLLSAIAVQLLADSVRGFVEQG
jgi:multiple antibiotic resistance protein